MCFASKVIVWDSKLKLNKINLNLYTINLQEQVLTPNIHCAALLTLVLNIAINLPLGFLPRVDNSAHIEGFLSGFPLHSFNLSSIWICNPQKIPPRYEIKQKSRLKCYQYLLLDYSFSPLNSWVINLNFLCILSF